MHSTFRFVFSRAELFTVQTRLTQALAEENKQTCLYEVYPLDREKLNTNIFLAERTRASVGIWNVKCLLLTMSMGRGPNSLYVRGILR